MSADTQKSQLSVVKIGSSTLTDSAGFVDEGAIAQLCSQIAQIKEDGQRIVVVTSGAIAAGWAALAEDRNRPNDPALLQAVAAVGQPHLMRTWSECLSKYDILAGQVLLAPLDFMNRKQYLFARSTLEHLLQLGVVPIINENDAVADEEIRYGDNDRLSALVAHLIYADRLVLLTDTAGLYTADPRVVNEASLIEEVVEIDQYLEVGGGPGSEMGSGGMASKLAAAKIASWSGIEVVIAEGKRKGVLKGAISGAPGIGTVIRGRKKRLPARKLWIAFALAPSGTLRVDDGAKAALQNDGSSLLCAGVTSIEGKFVPEDSVEIAGPDGLVFAKGLVALPSTFDLSGKGAGREIVHRDDLVLFDGPMSTEQTQHASFVTESN